MRPLVLTTFVRWFTPSPWALSRQKRLDYWTNPTLKTLRIGDEEVNRGLQDTSLEVVMCVMNQSMPSTERVLLAFSNPHVEPHRVLCGLIASHWGAHITQLNEVQIERFRLHTHPKAMEYISALWAGSIGNEVWQRWYQSGNDEVKSHIAACSSFRMSPEQRKAALKNEVIRRGVLRGANGCFTREQWLGLFEVLRKTAKVSSLFGKKIKEDGSDNQYVRDLYWMLRNQYSEWPKLLKKEDLLKLFKQIPKEDDGGWNALHVVFVSHPLFVPSLECFEYFREVEQEVVQMMPSTPTMVTFELLDALRRRMPEWEMAVEGERLKRLFGQEGLHNKKRVL
jgi:hypothetical protein